jgi:diphthine-ammonia ligase
MRLASLLSGGKDSVYSIQRAVEAGHDVSHAVTIFPRRDDSYMFHVPNLWLTSLQAQSMGIEHVARESSGQKEKELEDLREALRPLDVEGVVAGAIASNYQYERVSRICGELGLNVVVPLWGMDSDALMAELLSYGYSVVVVGVYADGMGPEWLGRMLDDSAISELESLRARHGIAISFEGGEAETLVVDCPIFSKRIVIEEAEAKWEVCRGEYLVSRASLEAKA